MNYRAGLLMALLIAGAGLVVVGLIVLTVDPTTTDVLTKAAFFSAFFLALAGLFIPLFFWGRVSAGNREILYAHFPIAVRQAVLVALLLTAFLILQSFRALSWWDAILIAIGALTIELAFRSRQ